MQAVAANRPLAMETHREYANCTITVQVKTHRHGIIASGHMQWPKTKAGLGREGTGVRGGAGQCALV